MSPKEFRSHYRALKAEAKRIAVERQARLPVSNSHEPVRVVVVGEPSEPSPVVEVVVVKDDTLPPTPISVQVVTTDLPMRKRKVPLVVRKGALEPDEIVSYVTLEEPYGSEQK